MVSASDTQAKIASFFSKIKCQDEMLMYMPAGKLRNSEIASFWIRSI